jgi:hypothetical protein
VLGTEPKALCILYKHYNTLLHLQPTFILKASIYLSGAQIRMTSFLTQGTFSNVQRYFRLS